MNGVTELNSFFSKAERQAHPKIKPFVIEMKNISLGVATKKISENEANHKMRLACQKIGVNPALLDSCYYEAQGIKSMQGFNGFDFDSEKKGKQNLPNINLGAKQSNKAFDFKPIDLFKQIPSNNKNNEFKPFNLFNSKNKEKSVEFKPIDLFNKKVVKVPSASNEFKPVDLFPSPNENKKIGLNHSFNLPNFAFNKKNKNSRFESFDLMPGPKGSNEIELKPIFPSKPKRPSKPSKIGIQNFSLKGLF